MTYLFNDKIAHFYSFNFTCNQDSSISAEPCIVQKMEYLSQLCSTVLLFQEYLLQEVKMLSVPHTAFQQNQIT